MRTVKRDAVYYQKLLTTTFEFMLISGIQSSAVSKIAMRALRAAEIRNSSFSPSRDAELMLAGLLLDGWHRNQRYVDQNVQPRAIPIKGRSPSLEALMRLQRVATDPVKLARRLISLGLVVRSGRHLYKPTSSVAVVSELDSSVQQHVARSLSTLLKTVKQNVSAKKNSNVLIERRAEIPDLPVEYVNDFQEFTKSQGRALLNRVNDWLESRRAVRIRHRKRITVGAGMHVFAYLDNLTHPSRTSK